MASGVLISPGGQQGIPGPNAVSTDAGNQATFGSDNKIYVPDPTPVITSVRLRSFNSVSNPNFEVTQRNCGQGIVIPGGNNFSFMEDGWAHVKTSPTFAYSAQAPVNQRVFIPGTSYVISNTYAALISTVQQPALAAGDLAMIVQNVEGPRLRELIGDKHSVSILAVTNVAGGLKFALSLRDAAATPAYSLCKLCTLAPNVWQLITLPNLPVFPSAGTFNLVPGSLGYQLGICFASGSTYIPPANDTWQSGNFVGAAGMDNLGAKPTGSYLLIGFVQHEPGSLCTQFIDKPFTQNYDECLRYYSKSYPYANTAGTATFNGVSSFFAPAASVANGPAVFPKRMAKYPATVAIYNPQTGTQNACYNASTGAQIAVTNIAYPSEAGFLQLQGTFVTGTQYLAQWTADTGW